VTLEREELVVEFAAAPVVGVVAVVIAVVAVAAVVEFGVVVAAGAEDMTAAAAELPAL
jgi:hypothetical protein